ncbi:hypothetical protein D3C86_2246950 [compost metagenome]
MRGKARHAGDFSIGKTGIESDDGQDRAFIGPAQAVVLQPLGAKVEKINRRDCGIAHAGLPVTWF